MKKLRITDRLMESLVYTVGALVLVVVALLLFYLAKESQYAFKQDFTWGYRFAFQPTDANAEAIELDPNATVVTSHPEGDEGVDAKEEGIVMPDLSTLAGFAGGATGTPLTGDLRGVSPGDLYRDDWRAPQAASERRKFLLLAFATPEYKAKTMTISWAPDEGADPSRSPFDLKLRLVRAPAGVQVEPFTIDLKTRQRGSIELPTFVAKTDAERMSGYVFEVTSTPTTTVVFATLRNFFSSDWGPTLAHPRYGVVPLLLSSLTITALALLIAGPIGIATAVYLSELAPGRLREWLKPTIELLASVPTVVLGYFGLMLVAPGIQNAFGAMLGVDSGRSLLTASIVMGVLLIPTIATVGEDALRNVPNSMRDGGFALGLTRRETLRTIVFPAAKAGMVAAVLLGMARAFGETMIIWMLSGGTPAMPRIDSVAGAFKGLVESTRGMPDTIAIEMGNVAFEDIHYGHLFMVGLLLFVITLAINLIGFRYARQAAWRH
ncbi:MAG: hypothetical protein HONBIEJF_00212 [Fimbriimonadaceae bacterium]|nr:hypothetical protein [Fimbriimonadaceae bacterium]